LKFYLLRNTKGANIYAKDNHGWNVLHVAVSTGNYKLTEYLISQMSKTDSFFKYINSVEKINGWSPLHIACIIGNFEIIELLLNNGSSITIKDSFGEYPYELVEFKKRELSNKIYQRIKVS